MKEDNTNEYLIHYMDNNKILISANYNNASLFRYVDAENRFYYANFFKDKIGKLVNRLRKNPFWDKPSYGILIDDIESIYCGADLCFNSIIKDSNAIQNEEKEALETLPKDEECEEKQKIENVKKLSDYIGILKTYVNDVFIPEAFRKKDEECEEKQKIENAKEFSDYIGILKTYVNDVFIPEPFREKIKNICDIGVNSIQIMVEKESAYISDQSAIEYRLKNLIDLLIQYKSVNRYARYIGEGKKESLDSLLSEHLQYTITALEDFNKTLIELDIHNLETQLKVALINQDNQFHYYNTKKKDDSIKEG